MLLADPPLGKLGVLLLNGFSGVPRARTLLGEGGFRAKSGGDGILSFEGGRTGSCRQEGSKSTFEIKQARPGRSKAFRMGAA